MVLAANRLNTSPTAMGREVPSFFWEGHQEGSTKPRRDVGMGTPPDEEINQASKVVYNLVLVSRSQ